MHALALYFLLLLFFLLLSLFFSMTETAFMAVNRLTLRSRAEAGDRSAETIQAIIANPDRLLSVILLGNNIANISAATLVTWVIATYTPRDKADTYSVIGSTILTLVVLVFCELAPKLIAATDPDRISRAMLWPLRLFLHTLAPLASLAAWCANIVVRIVGMSPDASPFTHALSEEEIRAIIAGAGGGNIGADRKEMLRKVFEIGATQIRGVMIPRVEVTAVDIDQPIEEVMAVVSKSNYSRIPVHRGGFENIVGILYVKDLLQQLRRPGEINIEVLLRPVHYVPDIARTDAVLRQLQSMHLHMAVVVDEFGGVEGIVTLEDILEEIVGEIRDEHDTEVEAIRELGPGVFSLAGTLPVKDFNRRFEAKLPESMEYTTIVGFLQTRAGRLLNEGEIIQYQDLTFSVEKKTGFRIVLVRVRVPEQGAEGPQPGARINQDADFRG